jgi:hypothetical protein
MSSWLAARMPSREVLISDLSDIARRLSIAGRLEPSGAAPAADATAVQTSNHEQDRETA